MDGQIIARINERWQALSITNKVSLIVLVASLLLASFYLSQFVRQMNYTTLFARLDPREAGVIVERLNGMRIPYLLQDGGTTIQVPRNRVDEARIHLATTGALGVDGAGWELFDKTKLGVTEFEQQINYQRALQEELRRTIVQLEEIEGARVHLVIPEKSIFAEGKEPPSASIALKIRPASQLNPEQVRGIVALVAGSVENLKPDNVQIIDMRGRLLNDNLYPDPVSGIALTQQEAKRNYEREVEKRLQNMLQRIVGQDRVVAMVTADLDFRQQQSVSVTPYGDPQPISEQTIREQGGNGLGAGGVPGMDANVGDPVTYPFGGQGQGGAYQVEKTITNYQVGTRQETIVQPPGELRRLATSVVVDGDLNAAQTLQIENVVAAALGYDPDRGDQIQVVPMAFDTTMQRELDEAMERAAVADAERQRRELLYRVAMSAAVLILVGIVLALVVVAIRRMAAAAPVGVAVNAVTGALPGEAPQPPPVYVPKEPEVRMSEKQQDLRELANRRPEDVAQIIKVWLTEK